MPRLVTALVLHNLVARRRTIRAILALPAPLTLHFEQVTAPFATTVRQHETSPFPRVIYTVPDDNRRRVIESVAKTQRYKLFKVMLFHEVVDQLTKG
jgi:hypothetical protein